jgi:putative DNA primase/helicase
MSHPFTATKTAHHYLDVRHRQELFHKRALDPDWCEVNCQSVTANQATEHLGYTAYSDGIWLEGANFQGQFKPNKPWRSPESNKYPKYRSPLGEYDIMLPHHPDNPYYWDDLEALKANCYIIDGHPCLVITEGFFKAIALCSHEVPTIALLGVEMGLTPSSADPQGKRYLVPGLEKLARPGFGFIHAFDADCATNPSVIEAQRKLVHQLKKFNIPQYNVTGLWTVEQGKGVDDYIQMNGADNFRQEVLGKAVSIETWEKQFQTNEENKSKKPPKAIQMATELLEVYRDKLAWHEKEQIWYRCGAEVLGIWSPESDIAVEAVILAELESRMGLTFSYSYLRDVIRFLKRKLIKKNWDERADLIPLLDGVLNKKTLELFPHSPGYGLTWYLPVCWKERATACGESQKYQVKSQNELILLTFDF